MLVLKDFHAIYSCFIFAIFAINVNEFDAFEEIASIIQNISFHVIEFFGGEKERVVCMCVNMVRRLVGRYSGIELMTLPLTGLFSI